MIAIPITGAYVLTAEQRRFSEAINERWINKSSQQVTQRERERERETANETWLWAREIRNRRAREREVERERFLKRGTPSTRPANPVAVLRSPPEL